MLPPVETAKIYAFPLLSPHSHFAINLLQLQQVTSIHSIYRTFERDGNSTVLYVCTSRRYEMWSMQESILLFQGTSRIGTRRVALPGLLTSTRQEISISLIWREDQPIRVPSKPVQMRLYTCKSCGTPWNISHAMISYCQWAGGSGGPDWTGFVGSDQKGVKRYWIQFVRSPTRSRLSTWLLAWPLKIERLAPVR